jgi:hypothetical protein
LLILDNFFAPGSIPGSSSQYGSGSRIAKAMRIFADPDTDAERQKWPTNTKKFRIICSEGLEDVPSE